MDRSSHRSKKTGKCFAQIVHCTLGTRQLYYRLNEWHAYIYRKFVPSYHASFLTIVKLTGDWSVAMSASVFVVVASCLAALAHGNANPGSCLGACNVHDPALIRRESDGKYFRFSTGNKISYASSSSIEGPWTVLGSVLPSGSSIDLPGNDDLWVSNFSLDSICFLLTQSEFSI